MRDLLLVNVITGLAAIHYLLKTKGTAAETTTWFYVLVWMISLIMLLWIQVYCGRPDGTLDYDENLSRKHVAWLVGGVVAVVLTSSLLVSGVARNALYVPQLNVETSSSLTVMLDSVLYNFVLVAPAEETMKVMGIMALYHKTRNEALSVVTSIGVWATLHGYFAYVGAFMPLLTACAFISGIILYYVMKQTGSILNAIIAHAVYNGIVILSSVS